MKCAGNLKESCSNDATHYAWIPEHIDDEFVDIKPSRICNEHATEIKAFSDVVYITVVSIDNFTGDCDCCRYYCEDCECEDCIMKLKWIKEK